MNNLITYLDSPPVPSEWCIALSPLLERPVELPLKKPEFLYQTQAIERNCIMMQAGLNWMIRKSWNSKHPVPGNRQLVQNTEALGYWLIKLQILCDKCFFASKWNESKPEIDSIDWFQEICLEFFIDGLQSVWRNLYKMDDAIPTQSAEKGKKLPKGPGTAAHEYRVLSKICTKAKRLNSPLVEYKYSFAELLAVAIALSAKNDIFRKNEYLSFIQAWQSLIKAMESWDICFVDPESQCLRKQVGKGKHTVKLA